jgi:hypothetical protein
VEFGLEMERTAVSSGGFDDHDSRAMLIGDDAIPVVQLLAQARVACGLPESHLTISNILESLSSDIPQLIDKMDPREFYQWFCPVWQDFEFRILMECSDVNLLAYKVGQIAVALVERKSPTTQEFTHPSLRAMCMSFMMNSLQLHPLAQTYALRMLLRFASQTSLSQETAFVHWILRFMQKHIEAMIQIGDGRSLFIEACVGFFNAITLYDASSIAAVLKFFGSAEFKKHLTQASEQKQALQRIATSTFNAALTERGQFFVFEIIRDTDLLFKSLDPQQQELLDVFVDGTLEQFDALIAAGKNTYVASAGLPLDALRFKMEILTFVTMAHDRETLSFAEAMAALKLDAFALKRLVVQINDTTVAQVRIDSVGERLLIEYCQPRRFGDEMWVAMADHLKQLLDSFTAE